MSDNSEFLNWVEEPQGPTSAVAHEPIDTAIMFKDGKMSGINVKFFHPGIHFKYGDEFLPPCMKLWLPSEYVGVLFQSTTTKADVTCQECKEWIHA